MNETSLLQDVLNNLPQLNENENVCLALSGGLDSTTLVYALVYKYGRDKVKTLSFDFGQRHKIELEMANKTAEKLGIEHHIYKLDYLQEISKSVSALIGDSELKPKTAEENAGDPQVNTYVPYRNAQFAFITAAYAEAKNCRYVFQGTNSSDQLGYWDTSLEFTKNINSIFSLNRQHPLELITPFVELYKDEICILTNELSHIFDNNILEDTWSCYNGVLEQNNHKHCLKCNTCEEMFNGMLQAGCPDKDILQKFNISSEELNNRKRHLG